jgi:hypothetical protein
MTTTIDLNPYCITQEELDNTTDTKLLNTKNLNLRHIINFTYNVSKGQNIEIHNIEILLDDDKKCITTDQNGEQEHVWICKFRIGWHNQFIKLKKREPTTSDWYIYIDDWSELKYYKGLILGMSIQPPLFDYVLK